MTKKISQLEADILNDFENLFENEGGFGDDSNLVERTANIWRDLLIISGDEAFTGTTELMVDTFKRNVWAAMTGHLDMSDYRIVWEYDPEINDVSIYNYLDDEPEDN